MQSLFKFFKPTENSFISMKESYFFFASAENWTQWGEYPLQINLLDNEGYKSWLKRKLKNQFADASYNEFRKENLNAYNKIDLYGTELEFDFLLNVLLEEAFSENGLTKRKEIIKQYLFSISGVTCFTKDENTLTSELHWENFASYNTGFCVEFDFKILFEHFKNTIVGGACINYKDEVISIDENILGNNDYLLDKLCQIFTTLPLKLKEEKEFRLYSIFKDIEDKGSPRRKIQFPLNSIRSIIFGTSIDSEYQKKLENVFSSCYSLAGRYKIINQDGYLHKYKLI